MCCCWFSMNWHIMFFMGRDINFPLNLGKMKFGSSISLLPGSTLPMVPGAREVPPRLA